MVALGALVMLAGMAAWGIGALLPPGTRLSGDIEVRGPGWRVSFPLATCILISIVLTVILNAALWLTRRP